MQPYSHQFLNYNKHKLAFPLDFVNNNYYFGWHLSKICQIIFAWNYIITTIFVGYTNIHTSLVPDERYFTMVVDSTKLNLINTIIQ